VVVGLSADGLNRDTACTTNVCGSSARGGEVTCFKCVLSKTARLLNTDERDDTIGLTGVPGAPPSDVVVVDAAAPADRESDGVVAATEEVDREREGVREADADVDAKADDGLERVAVDERTGRVDWKVADEGLDALVSRV
jgi:hypothetical protein